MDNLEQKVNSLQVEVTALKEKVSFFSVIYGKFDTTLEKVEKNMEERRQDMNNDLKEVYIRIENIETRIMAQIDELRKEMKLQHETERKKLDELNKWRWLVMGGAAVVGWILSKLMGNHLN